MNHRQARTSPRLGSLCCAMAAAALLSACVVEPPRYASPAVYTPPPQPQYQQPAYAPPQDEPVVSVYIDPPTYQPAPIAVAWAPPPMLVEAPPPQPYPDAIWTGGYWAWQGRWVWAAGRWASPPQPSYGWVQPYYEHRADTVVFVPGYWSPPEARFVPPPLGVSIAIGVVAAGVIIASHPPMGPQGVFIPPPPGSRPGIIIPAPIGTPPAVVVSAPPVVNVGMRVTGNVENNSHNTTINDNRVTNNVTNVTNVTIVAPAGVTANGQAFQGQAPARAHIAAGQTPFVHANAPVPQSGAAIPSYVAGRQPVALPAAQPVRTGAVNPNAARAAFQQPPPQQQRPNGEVPGRPAQAQPYQAPQQQQQVQPQGQQQQFAPPQRPVQQQQPYGQQQQQPVGQPQQPLPPQANHGQPLPPQGQPQAPQGGDPRARAANPNDPNAPHPPQAGQPGAVRGEGARASGAQGKPPQARPAKERKDGEKKDEHEKDHHDEK